MGKRVSRREVIGSITAFSFGALIAAACGGSQPSGWTEADGNVRVDPLPTETATPEPPFVIAAGESEHVLMAGTPQETPMYVFGSGQPGPIVMALGGVHGNEPGGWLAADEAIESVRPGVGGLIVVPRANVVATRLFERTTEDLGDLNRLYPGDPEGLPMARMAAELVDVIRAYHVGTLVDMHESWAFYRDRPQNGTAFLGQTVTAFQSEPGINLARGVVETVNARTLSVQEEFFYRDAPNRSLSMRDPLPQSTPSNQPGNGITSSSLGIPRWVDGLNVLLVEMGQQQELARRVALHLDVLTEVMRQVGTGTA